MLEIKKEDIKEYKVNKKSRKKRPSKPKKFFLYKNFTIKGYFNLCSSKKDDYFFGLCSIFFRETQVKITFYGNIFE